MTLREYIAFAARCVLDTRTLADARAVPKLLVLYGKDTIASYLLDSSLGDHIRAEIGFREDVRHMDEIKAEVYCCFHKCDARDCAAEHDLDDDPQTWKS